MAQAVADAVGATKRQVQIWTDAGVLRCLPGTDRQGRGRQRLYDEDELRFAVLARYLAHYYQIPIGVLKEFTDLVRGAMASGARAKWCRAAWQGDVQSSILNRAQQQDAFIWRTTDEILKLLPLTDGAVVINIHKIMNTIQR